MSAADKSLIDLFAPLGAAIVEEPLFDYGKLYRSAPRYAAVRPRDTDHLCEIVATAFRKRTPIRVRGSGHTFSGASLPRDGELLLRTPQLNHFAFRRPGTVTLGAGTIMWDARDLVRDHGFELPVYNGGWAGPTLGGYINAGGFGKSGLSEVHGGLWEVIERIALVDGTGRLRQITREDPEFPWMFGAFGQLGVVVEAELKIVPLHQDREPDYPQGLCGKVPSRQVDDPAVNDQRPPEVAEERLFWFTLMVSPEQEARVWQALAGWVAKHRGYVRPEGGWAGPVIGDEPIGYHYVIKFHNFNPPLVYPRPETFLVLGVMSRLRSGHPAADARLLGLENDFIELATANDFRMYLQAENIGRRVDFRAYYGDETFDRFCELRQTLDPLRLVNRDVLEAREKLD